MQHLSTSKLVGQTIVTTRDRAGNADFAARIRLAGAIAVEFDTIRIKPLTRSRALRRTFARLADYDWLVFTSANGVSIFVEYLRRVDPDCVLSGDVRIAAIGSGTAGRLRASDIGVDFVPDVFTSRGLALGLGEFDDLRGKAVLLLRSNLGSRELVDVLADAGARIDDVAIYEVAPAAAEAESLIGKLRPDSVSWITFASPSAVTAFFDRVQRGLLVRRCVRIASIGPITSARIRRFGLRVDAEANPHTIDGLLAAIESSL